MGVFFDHENCLPLRGKILSLTKLVKGNLAEAWTTTRICITSIKMIQKVWYQDCTMIIKPMVWEELQKVNVYQRLDQMAERMANIERWRPIGIRTKSISGKRPLLTTMSAITSSTTTHSLTHWINEAPKSTLIYHTTRFFDEQWCACIVFIILHFLHL